MNGEQIRDDFFDVLSSVIAWALAEVFLLQQNKYKVEKAGEKNGRWTRERHRSRNGRRSSGGTMQTKEMGLFFHLWQLPLLRLVS